MFVQLDLPFCDRSTSSAEASPVRTSAAPASVLASQVLAAVFGSNISESLASSGRDGSSSRTSLAELLHGSTLCAAAWDSSDMRAYRSRLRRRMLALRTSEHACSSLPTLMSKANLLSPSMQKWPAHRRLLPTLTAQSYGTNRGGAAGRTGKVRESLQTIAKRLLPTLTARDAKGPGAMRKREGGRDLPQEVGGHLNPAWCEWFMGFPEGWTRLEGESRHSATL
jgi:hypothetical protein